MDFIKVGSRLTMDLRIALETGFHTLTGLSHPSTDGMAVTENVPAEAFMKWYNESALFDPIATGMIFPIPADHDTTPKPKAYGFQDALDAAANDPEQSKLAEQGAPDTDPTVTTVAGLAVPLPNPLPMPPSVATITRPVAEPVKTETVEVPVAATIAPAMDSAKLDGSLKPDNSTSSNQVGTEANVGPATVDGPAPTAPVAG